MKLRFRYLLLLTALFSAMVPPRPAGACVTPVFRYALERWMPDPFPVIVYRRGPLTDEQKNVVEYLKKSGWPDGMCNIQVGDVDLDGEKVPEAAQKAWDARKDKTLPRMVVYYPAIRRRGLGPEVIDMPVTMAWAKKIVSSPVRTELFERIMAQHSVIWVVLESGNEKKDTRVVEVLESIFKEFPGEKIIPPLQYGAEPWKLPIAFSILRLKRQGDSEEVLKAILLNSEEGLNDKEYADEPVVFPVFGKGRTFYALVGEGINEENVRIAAMQVTGACSCEIKYMNPGVDLIMNADWMKLQDALYATDIDLPVVAGALLGETRPASGPATRPADGGRWVDVDDTEPAAAPETRPAPVGETAAADGDGGDGEDAASAIARNTILAAVALIAAVVLLMLVIRRKAGKENS